MFCLVLCGNCDVCIQWNCLTKVSPLSTHNICFGGEIRLEFWSGVREEVESQSGHNGS